jgi:hypothetical protein
MFYPLTPADAATATAILHRKRRPLRARAAQPQVERAAEGSGSLVRRLDSAQDA